MTTPASKDRDPRSAAHAAALVLTGLAVGLGVALTGHFIADGIRDHRAMSRHVEVKGLAEREVEADQASWVLAYTVSGDDVGALNREVDAHGAQIRRFLAERGIEGEGVSAGQILVTDQMSNPYMPPNPGPRYHLRASVVVHSDDVVGVEAAAREVNELVRAGILLEATQPTYRFTRLNEIKPAMLAEATTNARDAAEQFAVSAEQRVGPIREARQGVFSIEAAHASPDAYADPAQSRRKRVRVVTTLDYQLEG